MRHVLGRQQQQPHIRSEHADRAARIAEAAEALFSAVIDGVKAGMSLQETQLAQGLAPSIKEERRKMREAQARMMMAQPDHFAQYFPETALISERMPDDDIE